MRFWTILPWLALTLACGRSAPPPVIVVSIDTLRSDHLAAYGYGAGSTPAIDQLRRDSILFERAFSHVPLTLPAHASLFSGRLPTEHSIRDNVGYLVEDGLGPWLPALLRERGYATGGFVSAFVLRRATGMARGFEVFDDTVRRGPDVPMGASSRPGPETLAAALRWLAGVEGRPPFLFLHLYEPHLPYTPPEPFRQRFANAPYDGEIAAADQAVGELIAELRRLDLYDRALVVLLSDHGEGLGDHGEPAHGLLIYREALQVPLLVKLPGNERAGDSVRAEVQLIDVAPTLGAILDLPLPADLRGASLLEPLPAGRELYAESYYPQLHYGWQPLTSLIAESHHYIDSSAPELYDLDADPGETVNRAAHDRRRSATLRRSLDGLRRPLAAPSADDEATRQGLAALGYLTGSVATQGDPASLPAPQLRIGALADLSDAAQRVQAGDLEGGVRGFERVLAENPDILDAWVQLATAHARRRDFASSLDAAEKAFSLSGRNPDYTFPVASAKLELGQTADASALVRWALSAGASDAAAPTAFARRLRARGDLQEAEALLRTASERLPLAPAPLSALTELLASTGRVAEARTFGALAVEAGPEDADAHEQLALAELSAGNWDAARTASERAVGLDPRRANAWNHVGVARFNLGDAAGALDAWEHAVRIDPDLFDTLYNLGVKAAENGHRDQALWALRRFLARAPRDRYGADFPRVRRLVAQLEAS